MSVELHPHQLEAIAKLQNGCILYGGVGVGKTITSLGYYFTRICGGEINRLGSMQRPRDVYVITTAKVRNDKSFELQAAHYGVFEDRTKSTNNVKITVDSWNNIAKYKDVKDAFFIFDEQRVVGYGAWAKNFIKIARANEWILLSATPGDTWLDYIPVFIANGWYKHKTDFVDQHVIWTPRVKYQKVMRYQGLAKLVKYKNQVLVHMPYDRHTTRHPVYVYCDYDKDALDAVVKRKWHVYEDRPLRDASEMFAVMRKVVNTDLSRMKHLRELMKKHPKLIVFYNFDYELEMLRELGWEWTEDAGDGESYVPNGWAVAEYNGHRHDPVPLDSERWVYLVQYTAGSEGWNCIDTDAMVFWSQTYSYRAWWQAHGRTDRLNTPFTDLWYYNFISKTGIDAGIRTALRAKKNFNERNFKG